MTGDKRQKTYPEGFSLIEMVVSVAIFVFVILMVTSIFQNSIFVQKNAIATQNVQEGIRYAMEVMSKELRSATVNINTIDNCPYPFIAGAVTNKVYNFDAIDGVLYFRNRLGVCTYYYLSGGTLRIRRGTVDLPITPRHIQVSNFRAIIEDDLVEAFHSVQPNVTLSMDVKSDLDNFSNIKIQTTISSRHYE
jgi:prepilin-type N-terminal cleavage/methylation domain-containing protein